MLVLIEFYIGVLTLPKYPLTGTRNAKHAMNVANELVKFLYIFRNDSTRYGNLNTVFDETVGKV
ncbi:hypothetical protein [Singapore grouper iridovirus]|nr:hypothetical protein [Singapore grouper iridovirus]